MKLLIGLGLVLLALSAQGSLTAEQTRRAKNYYEECLASTGVDNALVLKGRNKQFVEDEKLMAYYHCFIVKMGFQNSNGNFNTDIMIKKLPSSVPLELGTKLINSCVQNASKTSKERAAFDVCKCFVLKSGYDLSVLA